MKNLIRVALGIICFAFACTCSYAQQKEGANWLFGGGFHLDFNNSEPVLSTFSFPDTVGVAVASISDRNGNLLFFSSGGRVGTRQRINGVYQEMPNGNLLAATPNRFSEAEMIVQSPADSNIFYLFFIDRGNNYLRGDLSYVKVDMRLNNGYGDVIPGSRQLVKSRVNSLKLSAAMHSNNRDIWILSQNTTNDSVFAHLVSPSGISLPVETKVTQQLFDYSRIKVSPNSGLLAVLGFNPYNRTQSVEVFDFNRITGVPSHKYSLASPNPDYWQYCFAFSPDNSKLFTGTVGLYSTPPNATVYQYDLTTANAGLVNASRNIIYNTTSYAGVGDMQLAMDGKIYLTFQFKASNSPMNLINSPYLSIINCPDFYGAASRFKFDAIDLQAPIKGGALPALNQTIFRNAGKLQAQAHRNVICAGDTVQLTAYGAGAEQFKWESVNGLTAPSDTLANPIVSPTVTTTYKVTGSSVCSSDSAFVTVTVLPKIPGITAAGALQVATLTEHQYVVQNPASGSTFNWQVVGGTIASGQGTGSIKVNWGMAGEGTVSVTEIPETGCNGEKVSLKVQIAEGPEPVIYNIFTPDNDEKNDAFVIENLQWYEANELRIYNRWGVEVYKTSNYQNNWKAENVNAGVYYYFFHANGKSWKGWVEVVK